VEEKRIIEIMEKMERNQQMIITILMAKNQNTEPNISLWEDGLKIQEILKISRATLYRLRKENAFTYVQKGGRTYYYTPDIFKVTNHFLK